MINDEGPIYRLQIVMYAISEAMSVFVLLTLVPNFPVSILGNGALP
jgi:hypothetical protein